MNDRTIASSPQKEGSRSRSEWMRWKCTGDVILVEDDEEVRNLVAHVLGRLGFTVCPAANGPAALAAFNDDPDKFILVVMHYNLPGKDATAVLRDLRRRRPAMPAVLTSAYSTSEVDHSVNGLESCAFLPKPFTIEALISTVHGLLHR